MFIDIHPKGASSVGGPCCLRSLTTVGRSTAKDMDLLRRTNSFWITIYKHVPPSGGETEKACHSLVILVSEFP